MNEYNANATYDQAIEWLMDRVGATVSIEVGQTDPQYEKTHEDDHADAIYMILHGLTLGEIIHGEDTTYQRGAAVFPLGDEESRNRFMLDSARFTNAIIHPNGMLQVTLHDTYLTIVASS